MLRYMKFFQPMLLTLTLAVTFSAMVSHGAWSDESQASHDYLPAAKAGEKWRIAYYEGGTWNDYYSTLEATVKGQLNPTTGADLALFVERALDTPAPTLDAAKSILGID